MVLPVETQESHICRKFVLFLTMYPWARSPSYDPRSCDLVISTSPFRPNLNEFHHGLMFDGEFREPGNLPCALAIARRSSQIADSNLQPHKKNPRASTRTWKGEGSFEFLVQPPLLQEIPFHTVPCICFPVVFLAGEPRHDLRVHLGRSSCAGGRCRERPRREVFGIRSTLDAMKGLTLMRSTTISPSSALLPFFGGGFPY